MKTAFETKPAILQGGWGYWRTDRYPIGGEFHRSQANMSVTLTGKVIDFGTYNGMVEFSVDAGVNGPKAWTGFANPQSILA